MAQVAVARVTRQRTRAQWAAVMTRFAQSRQRVPAFCKQIGVSEASFYRWRALLSGGKPACVPAVANRSKLARVNEHGCVDLGALIDEAAQPSKEVDALADTLAIGGRINVRVELGSGVVLQITRN